MKSFTSRCFLTLIFAIPSVALLSSPAASVTALSTDEPNAAQGDGNRLSNMSIYPNPAVSRVSVRLSDEGCLGSMLEVYDRMGQRVMVARVTDLTFGLDVSALASGVYFIRISDGKSAAGYKLLKL